MHVGIAHAGLDSRNRPSVRMILVRIAAIGARARLGHEKQTKLKEIEPDLWWRHLGNIQTSDGRSSVRPVTMHDGTTQDNIGTPCSKIQSNNIPQSDSDG